MAIVDTPTELDTLLPTLRTIAVLGIKIAETRAPAYFVAEFAQAAGCRVIPVPVYYPEVTSILGEPVVRRLAEIRDPVDAVVIFRRPADIPAHLDDILALAPRVVWMQSGIRHDAVAAALSAEGITVVQDRCLMVEMQERGL